MRTVCLLGASGSIGRQTLEILKEERGSFSLLSVSVGERVSCLEEIISSFPTCRSFCVKNEADFHYFKEKYPSFAWYFGQEGLLRLIEDSSADMVVNALLGFSGLAPSLKALETHKILCLANKESLVVGSHLIQKAMKEYGGVLYPIDSEHVALAKCLKMAKGQDKRLLLTASGGPFYFQDRDLSSVTVNEALHHPSWKMGKKITIDSATLMNKGFEVIEASVLFGYPLEKIDIIIHPESYVHSGVLLEDGTMLLQVSEPDMKGPISYALHEGDVSYSDVRNISSFEELPYTFVPFDEKRFPAVSLCKETYRKGGLLLGVLNAADEASVSLFLEGKIAFLDIVQLSQLALASFSNIMNPSLAELTHCHESTLAWVQKLTEESK